MIRSSLVGAVFALAILSAQPSSAQNPPVMPSYTPPVAPAAADRSLGMAIMSAIVRSDGVLISGSGVVSVTKVGTGYYKVFFERSVQGCAYSVTSGNTGGGGGTILTFAVGSYATEANAVSAIGYYNGNFSDINTHVLVFCHK